MNIMALRKRHKNRNQAVHNAILQVKRFRMSRAIYNTPDNQELELELETEDGEKVTLYFRSHMVPSLVSDMIDTYEAINPPLNRGSRQAGWYGMDN